LGQVDGCSFLSSPDWILYPLDQCFTFLIYPVIVLKSSTTDEPDFRLDAEAIDRLAMLLDNALQI
jgi:hypothetical protein